MINFLFLLFISSFHAEECTDQWTKRASSLVQVKIQETAPELYTPVSVIFTPNVPVPENLTDILLIPATSFGHSTSCQDNECSHTNQWDMVFFTKHKNSHQGRRDLALGDVLTCGDEVSECRASSIPGSSFPLIPTFTPTFKPTGAPSVNPSEGPSTQPSLSPSYHPSSAPSASPSLFFPSYAPTRYPTVKMHLKVDEEVLWKTRNVNLLKGIFSSLYEIPVDTIQLKAVRKTDSGYGGIDVELEVRSHRISPIEVKFEDQVYITDRLKETSNIVLENDGFNVISLETLKKWRGFEDLSSIICNSVTESGDEIMYKTRKVGEKWVVTLEIDLDEKTQKMLELAPIDFQDEEQNDRALMKKPKSLYTFVLNLGITKSELNTLKRIKRLKVALSSLLKGIYPPDITIKKIEESREVGVSRIHLEISTNENVDNFELNHEDEVFLIESVVSDNPDNDVNLLLSYFGSVPLVLSIVLCFFACPIIYFTCIYLPRKERVFQAIDIEQMLGEPGEVDYDFGHQLADGFLIPVHRQPGEPNIIAPNALRYRKKSSDSEMAYNSCEEGKDRHERMMNNGNQNQSMNNGNQGRQRPVTPGEFFRKRLQHFNAPEGSNLSLANSSSTSSLFSQHMEQMLRRNSSKNSQRSNESDEPSIVISSVLSGILTDDEEEDEENEDYQNEEEQEKEEKEKNHNNQKMNHNKEIQKQEENFQEEMNEKEYLIQKAKDKEDGVENVLYYGGSIEIEEALQKQTPQEEAELMYPYEQHEKQKSEDSQPEVQI